MGWLGKNFPAWSWSVLKISILCLQEAYLNNFCFTSPCQRLARPGCMQQLWCKHLLNMLYSPSPEDYLLHIKAHPLCLWRTRTCPGCSACRPRGTTASSEVAVLLQGWSAHKQFTDGIGFRRLVLLHIHHITLLQPWVSLSLAKPPKQQKEQVNSLCLSDGPEERHRENSTCSHGWVENRNVWWRYLALKITPLSLC